MILREYGNVSEPQYREWQKPNQKDDIISVSSCQLKSKKKIIMNNKSQNNVKSLCNNQQMGILHRTVNCKNIQPSLTIN